MNLSFEEIYGYMGLLSFEPTDENVAAMARALKASGVTRAAVNHLPDIMHPELLSHPGNIYLWFANFGPSLDQFVSSELNAGLYPETFLERNRRTLLKFAAAYRAEGITPMLYLCEPRFVPERFFARHPTLRGSRVDNPVVSDVPLYALCVDFPEVLIHYRQMLGKVVELIPDLSGLAIFTSDSGAGFDYNPASYAGSNGAGFNRGIPLFRRVSGFLSALLEEGQKRNPNFEVILTSGFEKEARREILAACPPGVLGAVYGAYDWGGGLEEQWAYHQCVLNHDSLTFDLKTLDRGAAAQRRFEDMSERLAHASLDGRKPPVHAEIPGLDYPRPLRYFPHPFETLRILSDIRRMGATRISMCGVANDPHVIPYDVNREAMALWIKSPETSANDIVSGIAKDWAGPEGAELLVQAWRDATDGWTHRPMWNHCGWTKHLLPGPLVPDPNGLERSELAYYDSAALRKYDQLIGLGSMIPHEADESRRSYVLETLYPGCIARLELAQNALGKLIGQVEGKFRPALTMQKEAVFAGLLFLKHQRNWYEAGCYLDPGENPKPGRSFDELIADELMVTHELIGLLDGRAERFLRLFPYDFMVYEYGPGIVDQLRSRIGVMERHRRDAIVPVSKQTARTRAHDASYATETA